MVPVDNAFIIIAKDKDNQNQYTFIPSPEKLLEDFEMMAKATRTEIDDNPEFDEATEAFLAGYELAHKQFRAALKQYAARCETEQRGDSNVTG